MSDKTPIAFMSYVTFDDKHENGRLTQLRERLSAEVYFQTREEFPIFQDRFSVEWGQDWQERIDDSLDSVTFLIPIITPGFFKSPYCRDELQRFLEREQQLQRKDLILPIYYVDTPILNDRAQRAVDKLAEAIATRQYIDWRDLRFEPFTSPQIAKMVAEMAVQIRNALGRVHPSKSSVLADISIPTTSSPNETSSTPTPEQDIAPESDHTKHDPVPKTEPPIIIVDPAGHGDYLSISVAIEAANPGDRILIRPGMYNEGLAIDKPLEIIGDGEPGEIVIQAAGQDALLFMTTMGRVVNLTLRQMGEGSWYGVNIVQGRLELEECDISSQSRSGIAIQAGADPILRNNRIHSSRETGIHIFDKGQGTLEDNDIFANTLAGVSISTGCNPTLRRNRIHDGQQSGVSIYENGQGTLEDNDIFANARSGVSISEGSNPILRRNRIHDSKASGVFVYNNGQGTLEDNDIFANILAGVSISEGSNPTLRRNRIHDGQASGVFVYENGLGALEDNDIFANAFAGVEIKEGGNPTLRRNRIQDGRQSGVWVHKNGQGTLEDNDISANASAGVVIETGATPTLQHNRINRNGDVGVQIFRLGGGTIEDNDLRDNAKGAWDISRDSERKVTRARNHE